MKRVTFLGLGLMGNAMARRLLEHGFDLTVWNRNARRADALVQAGAKLASTPAEGARGAEMVIAMLADDEASRAVWLGESGALAAMERGAVAIDSSTLTVECMRALGVAAAARGVSFLDAPVTGSKPQAEQGALRFLIGGDAAAVKRVTPVLAAMSREQVHLGPAGSGALLKPSTISSAACSSRAWAKPSPWPSAADSTFAAPPTCSPPARRAAPS
jgi:3-hydroxyisobutyrate dehydrogenase